MKIWKYVCCANALRNKWKRCAKKFIVFVVTCFSQHFVHRNRCSHLVDCPQFKFHRYVISHSMNFIQYACGFYFSSSFDFRAIVIIMFVVVAYVVYIVADAVFFFCLVFYIFFTHFLFYFVCSTFLSFISHF